MIIPLDINDGFLYINIEVIFVSFFLLCHRWHAQMFGLTTMLWCFYSRVLGSFTLKQVDLKCILYFN